MELSDNTKILLLLIIIFGFIIFIYNYNKIIPIKNAGQLNQDHNNLDFQNEYQYDNIGQDPLDNQDKIESKFYGFNHAAPGEKKEINYANGVRGGNYDQLDSFFDSNNRLVEDSMYGENANFVGIDDTNGKHASYKGSKEGHKQLSDAELYNVDDYLPNETSNDFFETIPDAISVKNRYLINTSRQIPLSTIATSNKNQSYDIRGSENVEKKLVGPWLMSSYEQDYNGNRLCTSSN